MGELHTNAKVSQVPASASSRKAFSSGYFSGMRLLSSGLAAAAFVANMFLPFTARAEPSAKDNKPAAPLSVPKPEASLLIAQGSTPIVIAQAGPVGAPDIAVGGSLATGLAPLANVGASATALAQAVSVAQDPELAVLAAKAGVPIGELQRLYRETKARGYAPPEYTMTPEDLRRMGWWSALLRIETPSTILTANAFTGRMEIDGRLKPVSNVIISVKSVNGKAIATVNLNDPDPSRNLARLYRNAMEENARAEGRVTADGKLILLDSERELKYVTMMANPQIQSDPKLGKYLEFYIVPSTSPNAPPNPNVPFIYGGYSLTTGKVYTEVQFTVPDT